MSQEKNTAIGKPMDRVDGRLKVTGAARYSAEMEVPDLVHAVLVMSAIAKGRIQQIDTQAAERAPGVLAVITHLNAPKLNFDKPEQRSFVDPMVGQHFPVLQSDTIYFNSQPIAVVVADTLEQAQYAASLVQVRYEEQTPATTVEAAMAEAFPPTESSQGGQPADVVRGNPDALASAQVRVEGSYTIPIEHHNPMEPHATIATWQGDKLTLYDKTQWVYNTRKHVALTFGMPEENVRVISPFVGGAFGSALRSWPHVTVAAIAARQVGRPVKLILTRQQMYTSVGFRPYTVQRVALGASNDGKLSAIVHEATAGTSMYEEYTEATLSATRMLYACPNLITRYRLVRLNTNTPTFMRAPGEVSGMYALECCLDELAHTLKLDPLELRMRNYAEVNPEDGLPWSSKFLKECYQVGAEKFGWSRRNLEPRSMRDGRYLVGMGMATATYPMYRLRAVAKARLLADGTAVVQSAGSDIGTGTYVIMTQIAADALGLPPERVRFELGDTDFPYSPVQGGSMLTASLGSAVQAACLAVREQALSLASTQPNSLLSNVKADEVEVEDGRLFLKQDASKGESYTDILKRANKDYIETEKDSEPGDESQRFSLHSFGAHFAEVHIDPEFGLVRVSRVVSVCDIGRVINTKTASSQVSGAVVGGIGKALMEYTQMDPRNGRIVNANLGEYHVPVNADVAAIETYFVGEPDLKANPLGARGVGEVGMVGVSAAIANAIFHATGKRIRDLPITPDKLL